MHLALFFAGYVLAAGFAKWLAIIPDTGISIWPPGGLFVATLLLARSSHVAWWVADGLAAELLANWLWFHNPAAVAGLLYAGNALCAVTGAWMIIRYSRSAATLETLRDVAALVLLGAIVAPMIAATVGAVTLAWSEGQPFSRAWPLWWVGDATGVLIVAPLVLVGAAGWQNRVRMPVARIVEAALVALVVVIAAAVSLGGHLPFAYIVMPPLLWAAVRFEFQGAVVTVVTLTIMAAAFTVAGVSPFSGDAVSQQNKSLMLQLFLAISALAALVVAAVAQQFRRTKLALLSVNEDLEIRVANRTQELVESRNRYKTLADNSPDILARFDRELRHVFVNAAVERATGRKPEEFIGKTNLELGMPETRCDEWARELQAVFDTGAARELDFSLNGPDGTRYYEGRLVPEFADDGEIKHVLAVTRDATDRVFARRSLQEADRRKTEFLAILAHELRNPLAAIRGAVHLLGIKSSTPKRLELATAVIDRQSKSMARLIDDLMDVNRISRGNVTLKLESVDLNEVLHGAIETTRPGVEESHHALSMSSHDGPVVVHADRIRLAQVFVNLIGNAAKYMDPGGRIVINVERRAAEVVVSVRDSGIGIAADKLPGLFEMFSQVESALSRSRGGLGIGLCLVKQLVEMHGGRVEACSEGLGKGSEFVVHLPSASVQLVRPNQTDDVSRHEHVKLRLLIVDDNEDGATTLEAILDAMGHAVRTAATGEQGVRIAAEWRPDVVLCDLGLPDLDGYSVCERIRSQAGAAGVHLVAVTGWGQDEYRQRSAEAGFDRHLVKPVDPQVLERTLANFRSRHDPGRLAELRRLMILDSSPERDFDAIAAAVAASLAVPIAIVNILDARRDWFKACVGLLQRESPAATSFCEAFFDSAEETIIAEDTTRDPRFQDHPLVVGQPHIRFYAATRLVVEGHVVGTLCAYDVRPRKITAGQVEELRSLAGSAVELFRRRARPVQV